MVLGFHRWRFGLLACYSKALNCADRGGLQVGNSYWLYSSYSILSVIAQRTTARQIHQNKDLPSVLPKRKKKPYITPRREGSSNKFQKKSKEESVLQPPANGLLVTELIPVAHEVWRARANLLDGVAKLIKAIPVKACRFCSEIHIGQVGNQIASCQGYNSGARKSRHEWTSATIDDILVPVDTFHLSDRLGKIIKHEGRFEVARIPAVVELCIQAGVDVPEFPTRRRTRAVQMIGKRILDFELLNLQEKYEGEVTNEDACGRQETEGEEDDEMSSRARVKGSSCKASKKENELEQLHCQVKEVNKQASFPVNLVEEACSPNLQELADLAERTLQAWDKMRSGARKLMAKYSVKVCGYCPEIHVGPKGHKVKACVAYKHQMRAGQHGWQEASIDDLIPPKYVWHVKDQDGPSLLNELRKFYGQTAAVVELCVQAGANVPERYRPMMRLDVVVPDVDEVEKVA